MANNNVLSMDLLKEKAVKLYSGMIIVFRPFGNAEMPPLNLSDIVPKFNGCYALNSSIICFIDNNEVFVIPYMRAVMNCLCSAGFKKQEFRFPLDSFLYYPKEDEDKWYSLCTEAYQSYQDDFSDDCAFYCDNHNIGVISKETLENCLEIPLRGISVKDHYVEATYYEIIKHSLLGPTEFTDDTAEKIGKFNSINGVVVFTYRDGKTYVTKGNAILSELTNAGYTKSDRFCVPLSNGGEIKDYGLRARWKAIVAK